MRVVPDGERGYLESGDVVLMGETPHHYLTVRRIHKARHLLAESRLPVRRIAAAVGYGSAASLSRAFKRVVGASPGAYRRTARAADSGA